MLAKENRLRKGSDFTQVFRAGKSSGNYLLVVHVVSAVENTEADLIKVGFVVGKKVGNSVIRHRVVRKLRHVICEYLPYLKAEKLVVRAQPAAAAASYWQLKEALEKNLVKLQVMDKTVLGSL